MCQFTDPGGRSFQSSPTASLKLGDNTYNSYFVGLAKPSLLISYNTDTQPSPYHPTLIHSKMGSGRPSKKPAPLDIPPTSESATSRRQDSVSSSNSTEHDAEAPRSYADRSYSDSWANYNQPNEQAPPSPAQTRSKSFKSPKATSPTANVYTHCGRHSNQWLFGDVNVTGLFRRNNKKD